MKSKAVADMPMGQLARRARSAGLYVYRERCMYRFYSLRTGAVLATYWSESGRLYTTGCSGACQVGSVLKALEAVARLQRQKARQSPVGQG